MTNIVEAAGSMLNRKLESAGSFAMHHVADSHEISLPYLTVHLPKWLSGHALMIVMSAFLTVLIFGVLYRRKQARSEMTVPTGFSGMIEAFVVFVRDEIAVRFMGHEWGVKLTPALCSFFSFILVANLVSLIPSVPAATADMGVTGALAAISLAFMLFGGIYAVGFVGFLKGFMPPGLPLPLQLALLPLEFFSMLVKCIALMIRLFANMLAGHLSLFLFAGVVIAFGILAAPLLLLVLFVYFMELFFAVLQAYIFTLLSAVFIGQRLHPEH